MHSIDRFSPYATYFSTKCLSQLLDPVMSKLKRFYINRFSSFLIKCFLVCEQQLIFFRHEILIPFHQVQYLELFHINIKLKTPATSFNLQRKKNN